MYLAFVYGKGLLKSLANESEAGAESDDSARLARRSYSDLVALIFDKTELLAAILLRHIGD